jgi:hypothetical protein
MEPFKKNKQGYYEIPRYRIMPSKAKPGWYFLWDRQERKVVRYDAWKISLMEWCEDNKMEYDCG